MTGLCGGDSYCFHFLFEAESEVMTCPGKKIRDFLVIGDTVEEEMGRSPLRGRKHEETWGAQSDCQACDLHVSRDKVSEVVRFCQAALGRVCEKQ